MIPLAPARELGPRCASGRQINLRNASAVGRRADGEEERSGRAPGSRGWSRERAGSTAKTVTFIDCSQGGADRGWWCLPCSDTACALSTSIALGCSATDGCSEPRVLCNRNGNSGLGFCIQVACPGVV